MQSRRIGKEGEAFAACFLEHKGYAILDRNYHSPYGEIDIIAADGRYIVFVEVKTRREGSIVFPAQAVTLAKQRKILLTAMLYLQAYPTKLQPRFDVIEITTHNSMFRMEGITHLENAFQLEEKHGIF